MVIRVLLLPVLGLSLSLLPTSLQGQEGEGSFALPPSIQAEVEFRAEDLGGWFPQGRFFAPFLANPQEPGFRAALLLSNLLAPGNPGGERPGEDFGAIGAGERDPVAVVALGESFPLYRWVAEGWGVQVGVYTGVNARFRLTGLTNDMVAHDWVVGVPVEWARGRSSARVRLYHRSAHLGDEIGERVGVDRIGFSYEALAGEFSWEPDPYLRFYLGGTRILRSETEGTLVELGLPDRDRGEIQGGIELRELPATGQGLVLLAGVDVQAAERTGWEPQVGVLAGVGFQIRSRSARLAGRFLHGPSMHGEFFLTPETAWGVEFAISR